MDVSRRNGAPKGLVLATYIAIGIVLHNVTEGIGIAATIQRERGEAENLCLVDAAGRCCCGSGLVDQQPGVHAAMVCVGACHKCWCDLSSIVEVIAMIRRGGVLEGEGLFNPVTMAGPAAAVGFMYLTAMLVKNLGCRSLLFQSADKSRRLARF